MLGAQMNVKIKDSNLRGIFIRLLELSGATVSAAGMVVTYSGLSETQCVGVNAEFHEYKSRYLDFMRSISTSYAENLMLELESRDGAQQI